MVTETTFNCFKPANVFDATFNHKGGVDVADGTSCEAGEHSRILHGHYGWMGLVALFP